MRETSDQIAEKLIKYIKDHPNQTAKAIEAGLNWSQNKVQRALKANASKLVKGWALK